MFGTKTEIRQFFFKSDIGFILTVVTSFLNLCFKKKDTKCIFVCIKQIYRIYISDHDDIYCDLKWYGYLYLTAKYLPAGVLHCLLRLVKYILLTLLSLDLLINLCVCDKERRGTMIFSMWRPIFTHYYRIYGNFKPMTTS